MICETNKTMLAQPTSWTKFSYFSIEGGRSALAASEELCGILSHLIWHICAYEL